VIRFHERRQDAAPRYTLVDSPLGELLLVGDGHALTRVDLTESAGPDPAWTADEAPFRDVVDQLRDYFDGRLTDFDLTVAVGGTPFQRRVWRRLADIPYGVTTSYGALARDLDLPTGAARAVGAANGSNPVPLFLPCHRVVASSGALTGYGLGGLTRKRHLLRLESGQLALDAAA
jgi:methylated-DNA-[protein]-cysteine S-methyltransferase